MSTRGSGANLEPLPFVRSFHPNNPEEIEDKEEERSKSSHKDKKSKRRRDRSSSRDRHRDRRRSRSRDRDSRRKKRRRSRSRSSSASPKRRSHRDSSYDRSSRYDDDRSSKYDDERERSSKYDDDKERSSKYEDRRQNRYEMHEEYRNPVQQQDEFPNNVIPHIEASLIQNNGSVLSAGVPDAVQQPMSEAEAREQRRKSRWSSNKAFVPGMPTILPSDLDDNQTQVYLLTIEIEECTRKLRLNEFMTTSGERSPSPEPIYDNTGKRLNTREVRKKQELEQRRHEKIMLLKTLNPDYKPPADYKPPNIRLHEKVWIPQEEHPEINFVGLLIGPRGNTLKALEQETGARIIIRGKGSIKEGKLLRREGPMPGENEPLHAYVTGLDMTVIKKACERIQSILDDALTRPDANNLLRQHQLRELAVLNGTLRPEDILGGTRCSNCGSDQHKTYECPEQQNVTANIICSACGAAGHIARDCLAPRQGYQAANNEELDNEYSALMAEISGTGGAAGQKSATQTTTAPFKLPPPQLNIQYTRPPVRQFQNTTNQIYASQPRHNLPPPPSWPPEMMGHDGQMHLDPTAAAAAFEAMNAASNGGAFPFGLLPPPPPPPPSMPDP